MLFGRGLCFFQRFINEVLEVPNRRMPTLPVQYDWLIIHTECLVNGTGHIAQGLARSSAALCFTGGSIINLPLPDLSADGGSVSVDI